MIDLTYTPEEQKEKKAEIKTEMPMMPEYPWGLRICLTEREIKKLGLKGNEFKVGQEVVAQVRFKIVGASCRQDEYDDEMHSNADLVITAMDVAGDTRDARAKAADTMYNNS